MVYHYYAFPAQYDRAEQGKVVDYVIIMGYDEHYVGSEEAGSVASIDLINLSSNQISSWSEKA